MSAKLWPIKLLAVAVVIAAAQGCGVFKNDPSKLLTSADAALARGDTSRAIQLLDGAVQSRNAPAAAYVLAGRLYRESATITGRLLSQQALENGLRRYPDDPTLWLELGKTQYAQTLYGDAARSFRHVLELEPGNCEAEFYLGMNAFRKWKYMQIYKEYLAASLPHFKNVVACDSTNATAFYQVAFAQYARGDTTSAISACQQMIQAHPRDPRGYLLAATIAYQRPNIEACDSLFQHAFLLMSEDERRMLVDIEILLTGDELEEYQLASPEKRETIQRTFWVALDPDPTTPLNERFLEHVQRMFLADAFFDNRAPRLRGWETERGKAVVKFGFPDGIGSTLAGGSLTGPMEMWVYSNEFVGLTLYFRDEFLNGNYMVPMDYRYSFAAQALYLDPPASHYVSPYWEIPGVMDVVAFRDVMSTTSDIYLAMKIDLYLLSEHVDVRACDRFFQRTAFFDQAWQTESFQPDTVSSKSILNDERAGDDWAYFVRRFEAPFDSFHVAFSMQDDLSSTRALLMGSGNTTRFLGENVVLSDILFHRPPPNPNAELIVRGGESLFPNPGAVYYENEKLRLYVEVYNLGLAQSRTDYEITYSIFDASASPGTLAKIARGLKTMAGFGTTPDPVISQTMQRRSARHEAYENLAVDISALRSGDYVLQIIVRDRVSGEASEQKRIFSKRPSERAEAQ